MREGSRSSSSSESSSDSSLNDEELAEVLRQVAAARHSHLHLHSPSSALYRSTAPPSPRPASQPPQPIPLERKVFGEDGSVRKSFGEKQRSAYEYVSAKPRHFKGSPTKIIPAGDTSIRGGNELATSKQNENSGHRSNASSAGGRHEAVSYRPSGSREQSPGHPGGTFSSVKSEVSLVSTSQVARGADRGLVIGPDGFMAPEEIRRRREERLERARQAARRDETFQPNTSRRSSPMGGHAPPRSTSSTGSSHARWESRLHDESVSQRRHRLEQYEVAQKSAALEAEMRETFQHCTFKPATAAIHQEKSHLKRGDVHAFSSSKPSVERQGDACRRLFESAKSSNPKSALELHREFLAKREKEEEERRQRTMTAAPAPVHLRLFGDANEKKQKMENQALLVTPEATIAYPIKNQWYVITPTQHADPESFVRLHSDHVRREAAQRELAERHKAPFAPTITSYAATMHGGTDAFTRLASAGSKKQQAGGSKASLAPASSVVAMSRQMSRVVTPDRDAALKPVDSGFNPPPLLLL